MCIVHRGVTTLDDARGKKNVCRPMLEPEVFRNQINCIIEESTGDSVGDFSAPPPQWFGAP